MDRKIVELLVQGASVTTITTGLKVGKGRIKRLREKAKAWRLSAARRPWRGSHASARLP